MEKRRSIYEIASGDITRFKLHVKVLALVGARRPIVKCPFSVMLEPSRQVQETLELVTLVYTGADAFEPLQNVLSPPAIVTTTQFYFKKENQRRAVDFLRLLLHKTPPPPKTTKNRQTIQTQT